MHSISLMVKKAHFRFVLALLISLSPGFDGGRRPPNPQSTDLPSTGSTAAEFINPSLSSSGYVPPSSFVLGERQGGSAILGAAPGDFKLNPPTNEGFLRPKKRPSGHGAIRPRARPKEFKVASRSLDPEQLSYVPAENWKRVTASRLNLRNEPGLRNENGDTQILAKISRNARMAVVGEREVDGGTWYEVMPMDCNRVAAGPNADPNLNPDLCNRTYWASGSFLSDTDAPATAEVQRRQRPAQEAATPCTGNCGADDVAATPVSISTRNAPADIVTATAEQVADVTQHAAVSGETLDYEQLLEAFDVARKEYFGLHPGRITQTYASRHRNAFVRHIIERLGLKNASLAITALTMHAEAGNSQRSNAVNNFAEMGVVGIVINNRATETGRNWRTDKRTRALTALGLDSQRYDLNSVSAKRIGAILAGSQFQPWNTGRSGNIDFMLSASKAKLARAFQAVTMIESGQITPAGALARQDVRNFIARGSNAGWEHARGSIRIKDVYVQTPWGVGEVKSHHVYYGVR